MTNKQLDLIKSDQEKKASLTLLGVFYLVFILYEVSVRIGKLHTSVISQSDLEYFNNLQLGLYLYIVVIIPVSVYLMRQNEVFKVKYACLFIYLIGYSLFEIILYHNIQMPYSTATIVDLTLVLLSPIFVNKRFFSLVMSLVFTKMFIVYLLSGSTLVALGFQILLIFGFIAYLILMRFANHMSKINELYEAKMEVDWYKAISYIDELTGVYNKRFFNSELNAIDSSNEKLIGFVMIDLDDFKTINDNYNHDVGDQTLKAFVSIISEELNIEDSMFRFGGDEFIVLLKNRTYEASIKAISAIQKKLETTTFLTQYNQQQISVKVTASIGMYYLHADDQKLAKEAFKEADNLLSQSKQKGKNCFTIN